MRIAQDVSNDIIHVFEEVPGSFKARKADATPINKFFATGFVLDNFNIGDLISIEAILYKVTYLKDKIQGAKVSMDIVAERWDNA